MLNWGVIRRILLWNPFPLPGVVRDAAEELPDEGLTMGTLIMGRPGEVRRAKI